MSGFGRKLQRTLTSNVVLRLSPATANLTTGGTMVVNIYLDAGALQASGVQAYLSYTATRLQYVSSTNSGSEFSVSLENTGAAGQVRIAVGKLGGYATGTQFVASITFSAIGQGVATVSFDAANTSVGSYVPEVTLRPRLLGATYTVTS